MYSHIIEAVNGTTPDNGLPHWGQTGDVLSKIIGWTYFAAWTISFYPQIWTNFRRKSVIGLSFDYVVFNIIGFTCYSAFNLAFYFGKPIQEEYEAQNDGKSNLVAINDVVFALHAVAATLVTLIQIAIYEKGTQKVSWTCRILSSCMVTSITIVLILAIVHVVNWIWFFYFLSYIKLAITLLKYIPQAFLNFRRGSTVGWNIWNVLLDFTGGFLSVVQLIFDGWRTDNWAGLIGDPVKFGLGFTSMVFDVIFMIQHYGLYKDRSDETSYSQLDASVNTVGGHDPLTI